MNSVFAMFLSEKNYIIIQGEINNMFLNEPYIQRSLNQFLINDMTNWYFALEPNSIVESQLNGLFLDDSIPQYIEFYGQSRAEFLNSSNYSRLSEILAMIVDSSALFYLKSEMKIWLHNISIFTFESNLNELFLEYFTNKYKSRINNNISDLSNDLSKLSIN